MNLPQNINDIFKKDKNDWRDFGILWSWAIKQEWWFTFVADEIWYSPNYFNDLGSPFIPIMDIINPEKFANAIYKFLKDRNNLRSAISDTLNKNFKRAK